MTEPTGDSRRLRRLLAPFALLALLVPSAASALPVYGARSGRICDNCHALPNNWEDPTDVADRKCSLSCLTCHIDPSGAGLRTVSGRYFAASTMPVFSPSHRPLDDTYRNVEDLVAWISGASEAGGPSSMPSSAPTETVSDQAPPPTDGGPVLGRPFGHGASKMAWLDGRYGDLRADPLLNVGGDLRFGFWNQGALFFPMQADLHAAVHPVEYVTVAGTVGARGRNRSLVFDSSDVDDQPKFGVRELWMMTHELPYMAYLRGGRFTPAFGTRVADHTAWVRRPFGLSQEDPANRVIGVEGGLFPNYPFLQASVFKPGDPDARDPFATTDGWGTALTAGWRDLGWQLGTSARLRRRPLSNGGDTTDLALHGAFNPWFYWRSLPLTWLFEIAAGRYQRELSGRETEQLSVYHQLAWTLFNGGVVRMRYDLWDPDREVIDDEIHRPGLGLDLTLIDGVTLSTDGRVGIPAGGSASGDVFVQIHAWF